MNKHRLPAGRWKILCSDVIMYDFDMVIIVLFIFPNYFKATLGKIIHGNLFTDIYTRFSVI